MRPQPLDLIAFRPHCRRIRLYIERDHLQIQHPFYGVSGLADLLPQIFRLRAHVHQPHHRIIVAEQIPRDFLVVIYCPVGAAFQRVREMLAVILAESGILKSLCQGTLHCVCIPADIPYLILQKFPHLLLQGVCVFPHVIVLKTCHGGLHIFYHGFHIQCGCLAGLHCFLHPVQIHFDLAIILSHSYAPSPSDWLCILLNLSRS